MRFAETFTTFSFVFIKNVRLSRSFSRAASGSIASAAVAPFPPFWPQKSISHIPCDAKGEAFQTLLWRRDWLPAFSLLPEELRQFWILTGCSRQRKIIRPLIIAVHLLRDLH